MAEEEDLLGLGSAGQSPMSFSLPPPPVSPAPSSVPPLASPNPGSRESQGEPSPQSYLSPPQSQHSQQSPPKSQTQEPDEKAQSPTVPLERSAPQLRSGGGGGGRGGGGCITVPQRVINFGVDFKFEEDPYHVLLNGVMSAEDYVAAICPINDALKECRATNLDHALLMAGPAMLPLIPWALRHKSQRQQRRKIMQRAVNQFNLSNTLSLVMRWQTRPSKQLTIWRKADAEAELNK